MASYTISGAVTEPDNVTPWRGFYYIGIYTETGILLDADGSWRAGQRRVPIDPSTGAASISLPASVGDEMYVVTYESFSGDRKGPWVFALTGNMSWADIIYDPAPLPPLPTLATVLADLAALQASLTSGLAAEAAARDAADDSLQDEIDSITTGGSSHIEQDTDGVPYFDLTLPGGLRVLVDTDGAPYYMTGI